MRVFRAVAERGSFTAAGLALGYTQSAVSRQVAVLERAAGVRLFVRAANGVRLTEAGRVLLAHASRALDAVDSGVDLLHDRVAQRPRLRLGAFATVAMAVMPQAITALRRRHPDALVELREASTAALVRSLRAGTLDAAVVGQQPPYPPIDGGSALRVVPLVDSALVVAVPTEWELGRGDELGVAELGELPWVAGPAGEAGFGVWPALLRRPRVVHQARDWMTKLALVAAGHGATAVPPHLVGVLPPGVRLVRVVDGEPVRRRASLVWRTDGDVALVPDLEECLRTVLEELGQPTGDDGGTTVRDRRPG